MASFGTARVYLASSLGGVQINASTGLVHSARAWLMLYQLQFTPDNMSYISGKIVVCFTF